MRCWRLRCEKREGHRQPGLLDNLLSRHMMAQHSYSLCHMRKSHRWYTQGHNFYYKQNHYQYTHIHRQICVRMLLDSSSDSMVQNPKADIDRVWGLAQRGVLELLSHLGEE